MSINEARSVTINQCIASRPRRGMILHALVLVTTSAWLLVDPVAISTFRIGLDRQALTIPTATWQQFQLEVGTIRAVGFLSLVLVVIGLIVFESRRFVSRRSERPTVRSLLFLTAMVGCWGGLLISYESIAWQGKRFRSLDRVSAMDKLAIRLDDDWPAEDGEIDGLGPYMAYPFGKPTVLLLLTPYPLDRTDTVISAIERSTDGALRFQLGGVDGGDWIEWHGNQTRPTSFTGGLSERFNVSQYVPLREDWYLVRYNSPKS